MGSRKDLLKLVVREGRFDWTPTATDDVYRSLSVTQCSAFHALRDTVSRHLHGLIGVNSYWAQALKPPHFYDHGARLYDEPPHFCDVILS